MFEFQHLHNAHFDAFIFSFDDIMYAQHFRELWSLILIYKICVLAPWLAPPRPQLVNRIVNWWENTVSRLQTHKYRKYFCLSTSVTWYVTLQTIGNILETVVMLPFWDFLYCFSLVRGERAFCTKYCLWFSGQFRYLQPSLRSLFISSR